MKKRFTIDGSDALESHLSKVCEQVRAGVRARIPDHKLEGLVLAGGYGRGEGGVLMAENADSPYNDLEFFVFIRGNTLLSERRYRHSLHQLAEELTPQAGIEVEFKILSLASFVRSETSMFYYDLVMGHQWLVGDASLFAACKHHRDATRIPLHEATRLLFNRCSGLLYAKERLQREPFSNEDADFVGRNLAKAQLALGDAWLTTRGAYHWSCVERQKRLRMSGDNWSKRLAFHHAAGVAFKLHPQRASASMKPALLAQHTDLTQLAEQLWLCLEGKRIGTHFPTSRDYAEARRSLCPERSILHNLACNLRAFGPSGLLSRFRTRYPRERLLRSLALLLWGQTDASVRANLSACLNCGDSSLEGSVRAYENLWHRFN